jgi:hypothetical protein
MVDRFRSPLGSKGFSLSTEVFDNRLGKLAEFLANVAGAWDSANQEQRDKLAEALFEI